jgi:hypothetical protein
MSKLLSIFETCAPREDVLGGELAVELFAARFKHLSDPNGPEVYKNPTKFFENTFPTDGLKTLISEVFGRLVGGKSGSPVLRLETSFGGGKTHDQIALWHIAKSGRALIGLERFVPDLSFIPENPVQVAAIDGQDLDPINGIYHSDTGITTYTLWGEIAHQIGGVSGYQLLKGSDEQRVSPGTQVIERLTGGKPTLIILDEIARYLRAARAVVVADSTLAKQVVAFLFSLMGTAASTGNIVFVYSLASSTDSFSEETEQLQQEIGELLSELTRASARQERVLSPSTDLEIYNIVKQRLFTSVSAEAAEIASTTYLTALRNTQATLPDSCKDTRYAQAIENSYPFHPELFSLLTKKIASIPEFQRTRGALRLFAMLVRHLWSKPPSQIPLIHTHHVPIGVDNDVTSELTSRIRRSEMLNAIGADIYNKDGREAHAQVYDKEWQVAGRPPLSSWVARTIFLHSLPQGIACGVRRAELNLSLLTPGLEIGFVEQTLERLSSTAWFLDDDPITSLSRFKAEPSINKIIAEETEQVGIIEAKEDLRTRRDSIFADRYFKLVASPEGPQDVDDRSDGVALCIIDFNEATVATSTDAPPELLLRIFNNTGESGRFRSFRNRLLFLVANRQELARAIENARQYRAIQNILKNANRLADLSEVQQKQLKEKGGAADLAVRVSLTNAYRHLFYPTNDPVKAPKGLLHYVLPAQEASEVKGKNNQQEVILKTLVDSQKIRPDNAPPFAPAFILQKVWPAGLEQITTKALSEVFAREIGLNILLESEVPKLRDTIRQGLTAGSWDMKMGQRVFIKVGNATPALPETIEFSDRQELYRRNILKPPEARVVELDAVIVSSEGAESLARVRWKARGALKITLLFDGQSVSGEFRPSDEHTLPIRQAAQFKVIADYGDDETVEATTNLFLGGTRSAGAGSSTLELDLQPSAPPSEIEVDGSPTKVFATFADKCTDYKVKGITSLEFSVAQAMDLRKLATALPLFAKYSPQIDQSVTARTSDQFFRLEYQGALKGFQAFSSTLNTLLSAPDVQADASMKVTIDFKDAVSPTGNEIQGIAGMLGRNPVDRLYLTAIVKY